MIIRDSSMTHKETPEGERRIQHAAELRPGGGFAVAEVRCAFESAPPTPTPARPARESAPIARHGCVVVAPTAAVAPARADREALPGAILFSKEPIGREHVVGESRK